MTVEEIAQKLNSCSNVCCDKCDYKEVGDNTDICRPILIKKMADECRHLVEEEEIVEDIRSDLENFSDFIVTEDGVAVKVVRMDDINRILDKKVIK